MSETFAKKESIKKKAKKKQQKEQERQDRKANNNKGKSLDEMMVYVDENGNFTTVPQDLHNRKEVAVESIQLGAARVVEEEEDPIRKGKVTFLSDKGFGFITETGSQEKIFVHVNDMVELVKLNDKVSFKVEKRERGPVAVEVRPAN